jgi:hypothetical protein
VAEPRSQLNKNDGQVPESCSDNHLRQLL